MHVVYGFVAGIFAGGTLSYLYTNTVIAKAKAEAAAVGSSVASAAKKL